MSSGSETVTAARQICQEASWVLTSLRGGPPHVARGDLAQDLMDLRLKCMSNPTNQQATTASSPDESSLGVNLSVSDNTSWARPFLQVVVDPRAAGPHTLVALQSIQRLQPGAFQTYEVPPTSILQATLDCKFEQTDPGADEAVEMAIADVLGLLIRTQLEKLEAPALVQAFTTIFSTRNTFVHSPALCYHFEKVLAETVTLVFQQKPSVPIMEFLVHQLLHTPLLGGDVLDESIQEAQIVHDATRVLCLRLVRMALQAVDWGTYDVHQELSVLPIVQDDLCLSLLMTGQAIWAHHDAGTNIISPGFVSTEVLSEICTTLAALWNCLPLRLLLVAQFETIFTGFYTRALVLLRQRRQPEDHVSFNANLIFDAEVEIILESLVDIFCLHDSSKSIAQGDGGALETIFAFYDCHMRRSDVAMGLIVELCRCCGGVANSDEEENESNSNQAYTQEEAHGGVSSAAESAESLVFVNAGQQPWRHVPVHLKELCAQAIQGSMKCLFMDDQASDETMLERSRRRRSIMANQEQSKSGDDDHFLRDLKARKRLTRKAARVFNKKASRGIEFLADAGLLPDPVTPLSVAQFLRNGIVVGLDKVAVGSYLGEAGKAPVAGKSPPCWERDWFHKEVLQLYCKLFRFEGQGLLDGLRMFLAAFRLPGEAQQIDRILQAFSDSCGQVCEESCSGRLKLFSEDPKRASDAAYLLSFSIIMLNTDRHNDNIREDRKMSVNDFVKNNTDYGRDITEKGKEFPREFLEGIYNSINEEEIRTEGEGADGAMTVERWKDVLRGSTETSNETDAVHPSTHDVEDLSELVIEQAWKPIISAVGGLWGAGPSRYGDVLATSGQTPQSVVTRQTGRADSAASHGGMMGVQGARLGMDMSMEMLQGIRQIGRVDIFRKIFNCICDFTGLIGDYSEDSVERAWRLSNSIESQSAVVVAFRTASDAGADLDDDCWKQLLAILLELRDLKMVSCHKPGSSDSLLHESETDLLTENARRQWNMCLIKGDMDYDATASRKPGKTSQGGLFGAFGRALFGSDESIPDERSRGVDSLGGLDSNASGKHDIIVWDEGAPSDDEEDPPANDSAAGNDGDAVHMQTLGAEFQNLLIRESMDMSRQMNMPVTGLERMEETRRYQLSPRARVRDRFRQCCRFESLVVDSRFMEMPGLRALMNALVALINQANKTPLNPPPRRNDSFERTDSDTSSTGSSMATPPLYVAVSPASEAMAEVLLCEIALKNKDRLAELWQDILQDHYVGRLTTLLVNSQEGASTKVPVDPGLEKRVTGLIRLSISAVKKTELANEIMSIWKFLLPMNEAQHASSPLRVLDKHMGEGLWRIVAQAEELTNLREDGWEGLMSLCHWCATRASAFRPLRAYDGSVPTLSEDDVALQCYRSLHLILNTEELDSRIPYSAVESLRILVLAGESRKHAQLSVATLDLLGNFLEKKMTTIDRLVDAEKATFWTSFWRKVVEGLADASEKASDSNVRQHALSLLTDIFLDRQVSMVPTQQVCDALAEVCVPLAGRCISRLECGEGMVSSPDELMIEFELCIGLIFKPLRHHLKNALQAGASLSSVWKSVLSVLEGFLAERSEAPSDVQRKPIPREIRKTMNNLANEHLQNAITLLITAGVIIQEPPNDMSTMTWEAASRMGISEKSLTEWKQAAAQAAAYNPRDSV